MRISLFHIAASKIVRSPDLRVLRLTWAGAWGSKCSNNTQFRITLFIRFKRPLRQQSEPYFISTKGHCYV